MPVANTALKVSDLDFNSVRNNLKNYLKGQSEFTDYDFEGSGMSVLLDILAYNTYYNSFYLNMAANEAFLDTAQLRNNILSHAKVINYVPTSRRGSIAKVNVKVTPTPTEDNSLNTLYMDKYTRLQGAGVDGQSFPFVTVNANTSSKVNNSFSFANVIIKQGEVLTQQYVMTANNTSRRFEIPSANVDTSTISITVQESSSNTYTREYFLASDITNVDANSFVYFLEENDKLNYTFYFGDGVIGYKPKIGNIIIATYVDTLGAVSNNISKFAFIDAVGGQYRSNIAVTTVNSSYGGTDKESIDQIRFRAPYSYTAQNRAVTAKDYEALISKDYPSVQAVSIWGGEDNNPPVYGKVYISLKTKGYYSLSNLEKENIKNTLIENRNILTVTPEIIDPDYVWIMIRGKVTYNPALTYKDQIQLRETVKSAIDDYNNKELNTFKSTFRKSKLQYYIENSDPSITGTDIVIIVQKQFTPLINQSRRYDIDFNMPLKKGGHPTEKLYSYPQIAVTDTSGTNRLVFIEEVPDSYTGIKSVEIVNPGRLYTSNTTIEIVGDGIGANAVATVENGKLMSIAVTNKGTGYTSATVVIRGNGLDGSAKVLLDSQNGMLRTYYYKPNGEKIIVNENAGTINYETGKIVLTALLPKEIVTNNYYEKNVVTINAIPEEQIIRPLRNRILTIDQSIVQSIQIDMVPEIQ